MLQKMNKGAGLVEYGLITGLIGIVAIGATIRLSGETTALFEKPTDMITTAMNPAALEDSVVPPRDLLTPRDPDRFYITYGVVYADRGDGYQAITVNEANGWQAGETYPMDAHLTDGRDWENRPYGWNSIPRGPFEANSNAKHLCLRIDVNTYFNHDNDNLIAEVELRTITTADYYDTYRAESYPDAPPSSGSNTVRLAEVGSLDVVHRITCSYPNP